MSEIPVDFEHLPDGKRRLNFRLMRSVCLGPEPGVENPIDAPGLLIESITPPRRMIGVARWQLRQLQACIHNEGAALMFLETLVIYLRSSTFVLQKLFASAPGFKAWWATQQQQLIADPKMRWIKNTRDEAIHAGLSPGTYSPCTTLKFYLDGRITQVADEPQMFIEGENIPLLVPDLAQAIDKLHQVIEDAHAQFHVPVRRKIEAGVQTLKEQADGSWSPFDAFGQETGQITTTQTPSSHSGR